MAKPGFLARHGIVRNAIRQDLLYFAIPAVVVYSAGLVVSARDGYDGLLANAMAFARNPENLSTLSVQSVVGLALIAIGFTIAMVAVVTLRRSYASTLVIREGHRLITHGVYRFSRHPIYLGVIAVTIGVPVSVSSLYGLATMSALIPLFLVRIKIEERMLAEQFGDAHRNCGKATSKLIPFIY